MFPSTFKLQKNQQHKIHYTADISQFTSKWVNYLPLFASNPNVGHFPNKTLKKQAFESSPKTRPSETSGTKRKIKARILRTPKIRILIFFSRRLSITANKTKGHPFCLLIYYYIPVFVVPPRHFHSNPHFLKEGSFPIAFHGNPYLRAINRYLLFGNLATRVFCDGWSWRLIGAMVSVVTYLYLGVPMPLFSWETVRGIGQLVYWNGDEFFGRLRVRA